MIPGIKDVLRGHLGAGQQRLSLVRIATTNPIYLVFDDTGRCAPRWAVRFGEESELTRIHGVLNFLSAQAPGLVPASLLCTQYEGGTWVHVQEGIEGTPWFQLQSFMSSRNDWERLRRTALDALRHLQLAIAAREEWTVDFDYVATLKRCVDAIPADGLVCRHMEVCLARVRSTASGIPLTSRLQHGDFCLNNLLFGERGAAVIDFEEFGCTAAPLFDEFGLALSLYTLVPSAFGIPLSDHLAFCLSAALAVVPALERHLENLFVLHVLTRLQQCQSPRHRTALAAWLRHLLADVGDDLPALFAPTRQALGLRV